MEDQSEETVVIDSSQGSSSGGTGGGGGGGEEIRPEPVKGVRDSGPPPFVINLYKLVNDKETDPIISWVPAWTDRQNNQPHGRTSFAILDEPRFIKQMLPLMSRSTNFDTFVTQLNNYGFKKTSWDRREYANQWFQEGKPDMLKNIKRRVKQPRAGHQERERSSCLDKLKLDMQELIKRDEELDNEIAAIKEYMETTMTKQRAILQVMAKAIQSTFEQRRAYKMEEKNEMEDGYEPKQFETIIGENGVHEMGEKNEAKDAYEVEQVLSIMGEQSFHEMKETNKVEKDGYEAKEGVAIAGEENVHETEEKVEVEDGHEAKQVLTITGTENGNKLKKKVEEEDVHETRRDQNLLVHEMDQEKNEVKDGYEVKEDLTVLDQPLEDLIENPLEIIKAATCVNRKPSI